MYGKIFESMYDGTLSADWKAMIVFQQLIVLASSGGVVDYTPPALSRRTGIPLDIIEHGLGKLQEPDKYSRSSDEEGRRIVLIDDHRNWGWYIVNFEKYRDIVRREDKLKADRERVAKKRNPMKSNENSIVSQNVASVANVAHEEEEEEEEEEIKPISAFDRVWQHFPRKVRKKDASEYWKRQRKTLDPLADQIIEDIEYRKAHDAQWASGYIPHPITYLRGQRWEDDIAEQRHGQASPTSPAEERLQQARRNAGLA